MSLPKISCLTITKNRLEHIEYAIASFTKQTYPNKEYIIITHGSAAYYQALQAIASQYPDQNIRIIQVPEQNYSLGWLRNQSVIASTGEIICQWDDDDWYHPDRIRIQYEAMLQQNAKVCTLTDQLYYLGERQELYWIDWMSNYGRTYGIPCTIMAYKNSMLQYAEQGQYAYKGEDADLLDRLVAEQPLALVSGQGHIYVYCCHGTNTSSYINILSVIVCCAIPLALFPHLEVRLRVALNHFPVTDSLKINLYQAGALFKYHAGLAA